MLTRGRPDSAALADQRRQIEQLLRADNDIDASVSRKQTLAFLLGDAAGDGDDGRVLRRRVTSRSSPSRE